MARIVTYNVHGCVGTDRQLSPRRIAQTLAALQPDIIALQEIDVGRRRSGGVDQAAVIAKELGMDHQFHPALTYREERYGDAILTSLPLRLVKAGSLPTLPRAVALEPRGALWVEILFDGRSLQVINTHLGLIGKERVAQVEALLGPEWLGHPACTSPAILTGDFNAPPPTAAYRRLRRHLQDAQRTIRGRRQASFPSRLPILSLDHVFFHGPISIDHAGVVATQATRVASDHLPFFADFDLIAENVGRDPTRPNSQTIR